MLRYKSSPLRSGVMSGFQVGVLGSWPRLPLPQLSPLPPFPLEASESRSDRLAAFSGPTRFARREVGVDCAGEGAGAVGAAGGTGGTGL